MLIPVINWIPFDKNNPPKDLVMESSYLIFLKEDDYDNGATWEYSVDVATPYGRYLDDFWDTENDWKEGQRVEVLAYAEFPYGKKKEELVDTDFLKERLHVLLKVYEEKVREDVIEELLKELCIGCAYLNGTKCEIKGGCPCSIGQSEIIRSANKVLEQLKEQKNE